MYGADYYEYAQSIDEVFRNLQINKSGSDESINLDLSELIKNYIKNKDNIEEYFKENSEVVINDLQKIIITNIYIDHSKENNMVEMFSMDMYLLEK